MRHWIARLREASIPLERWLDRLYLRFVGLCAVVLGTLLILLSGRGLLAYASGIRAAWSDPLAVVAGLGAGVLSLWAGAHLLRGARLRLPFEVSQELEATLQEAMRLERTDPTASERLLDEYFRREVAATESRRAELRDRAAYDLSAALELRRQLRDEMASNALVRKDALPHELDGEGLMAEIEAADQQLHAELRQLEGTIERLKLR